MSAEGSFAALPGSVRVPMEPPRRSAEAVSDGSIIVVGRWIVVPHTGTGWLAQGHLLGVRTARPQGRRVPGAAGNLDHGRLLETPGRDRHDSSPEHRR